MIYASAGIPCQLDPAEPKAKADTGEEFLITADPALPCCFQMSNWESCFCSQRGGSGGNEFVSRILLHRGSTKCRRGKVTGCSRGGAEKGGSRAAEAEKARAAAGKGAENSSSSSSMRKGWQQRSRGRSSKALCVLLLRHPYYGVNPPY